MRAAAAAVMVLCSVGSVQASAPRLVRSEPADGQTDVRPDIGTIRFYFDQPMDTGSWTLWASDKGTFPTLAHAKDTPWRDPQCLAIRVKTLAPNTTYAIQLNSTQRQGVRSADGAALPITVVTFRTLTPGVIADPPEVFGIKPASMARTGQRFAVRRKAAVIGTIRVTGERERPVEFRRDVEFTETVKRVAAGRAAEVERVLGAGADSYVSAETGKQVRTPIGADGDVFAVVFSDRAEAAVRRPDGAPVDVRTGAAMQDRLTHDLLVEGKLAVGRCWRLRGDEVTRRFRWLSLRGGELTLRVARRSVDKKTGAQSAEIEGDLVSQVAMPQFVAQLKAKLEITIRLEDRMPTRVELRGVLASQGTIQMPTGPTGYAMHAKAEYTQIVRTPQTPSDKPRTAPPRQGGRPSGAGPARTSTDPSYALTDQDGQAVTLCTDRRHSRKGWLAVEAPTGTCL